MLAYGLNKNLKKLRDRPRSAKPFRTKKVGGGGPSSEYAAFIKNEQAIWSDIVKRAGIKPD